MRPLHLYSPDLKTDRVVALPGHEGISAWASTSDGRHLALGDFSGHLYLLDVDTLALRALPAQGGREVTWLSFSEDDAWLAAATFDGGAHVFDVASGKALQAGQMQHGFTPRRVGISRAQRTLIVAGEGQMAMWRLGLPGGPRITAASRVGASPARHGLTGAYPIGWSLATGLLASAGMDGQVRLWRLPASPLQTARAARQLPERGWFDGRHLVDVEHDQLRVVDLDSPADSTPWLKLEQPPGFAELSGDGRRLIVVAGTQLRVYDAATLRLLQPPLPLPESPQRLLPSRDGTKVVLSFSASAPEGFVEDLRSYDIGTALRETGRARLPGPLRQLRLSGDGTRLLSNGMRDGAIALFEAHSLHPLATWPSDPDRAMLWADFDHDDRRVLLAARNEDPRLDLDALLVWDPASAATPAPHATGTARPLAAIASPSGAFVAGIDQDLFFLSGGAAHVATRLGRDESTAALATSHDGRVVAHGFRREVQLYDAASGETLGPPLPCDTPAFDMLAQLVFSPDDQRLLGRTLFGHWLVWRTGTYGEAAQRARGQLAWLTPEQESQHLLRLPDTAEVAALRALDPGPWQPPPPRPAIHSPYTVLGAAVPPRPPGLSPRLLDLTAVYNYAPETLVNSFYNVMPAMRPLPVGTLRIGGVDYDVRGMAQVGRVRGGFAELDVSAKKGIAVPPEPVAAVHVLMLVSLPTPVTEEQRLADIVLHYRDGSTATLPLRSQRELPGYSAQDEVVPQAWAQPGFLLHAGFAQQEVLSNPRLPNPHPERLIQSLDLVLNTEAWSGVPLFLALTVEPVTAAAESGNTGLTDDNRGRHGP